MPTKDDILIMIKELDINVDTSTLNENKPLREQGLDSLDMATIIFEISDRYSIKVKDKDIENGLLSSINKMIKFVEKNT